MSAFYSVCYQDRIEVLTDGAVYTEDGCLVDITRKIFPNRCKPAAVTGRGNHLAVLTIATWVNFIIAGAPSVDEAFVEIDAGLRSMEHAADGRTPHPVEILVACISESRGPVNVYFASADIWGTATPWRLHIASQEFGGATKISEVELASEGITRGSIDNGLEYIGVRLFDAFRTRKGTNPAAPDRPAIYGVGGQLDYTVISKDGVSVRTLHEWPDEVGKPIEPARVVETIAA